MRQQKDAVRPFALIEVTGSSVGCAVGVMGQAGPMVVWCDRLLFKSHGVRDFERLEKGVVAAALEGTMRMASEGAKALNTAAGFSLGHVPVTVVYAPPWLIGTVSSYTRSSERPTEVTERDVRGFVTRERDSFLASELVQEYEYRTGAVVGLPSEIIKIELNGYPFSSYVNKQAQLFSVSFYHSAIPSGLYTHMQDVVAKTLPHSPQRHVGSTWLLSQALVRGGADVARAYLIEVGNELTTVSYVTNRALSSTVWFSLGSRGLNEEITAAARTTEEANTAVDLRMKSMGEQQTHEEYPFEPWRTMLTQAAKEAVGGLTPPSRAFVTAEEGIVDAFLTLARVSLATLTEHAPQVELVEAPPSVEPGTPAVLGDSSLRALARGMQHAS